MARLHAALDLAEIEWSRPAGSRAEAIWYAMPAVVELMPAAWLQQHPDRTSVPFGTERVA